MNAPDPARAIARGLVDVLLPALAAGAPPQARDTARDVAQVMGLDGLDAVLAELDRMQGVARPADVEHVTARLARLAEEAAGGESAAPFHDADAELASLARALRETEWSRTGDDSVAVYPATEVLSDLPLQPNGELPEARLSAPVAASLRAALEWVGADEALLVQAIVHDSALSLTFPVAHEGGLGPAGAVLASIQGGLVPESDGRWTLRVPLYVERPSFLLMRIGHIPVALPWHSVARMRMLPPAEWAQQPEPVMDPLTTLQPGAEERPGALVVLGLSRAWFVADRIVWRYAAVPEETHDRGPFASSTHVVSVDNGEQYWVLEPSWLLRAITPTAVAPPSPRPRFGHVAPAAEPAPAPAEAAAGSLPDTAAMADAVTRALEVLREEREAQPAEAAPAPSREMPRPEFATPASRELPRPEPVSRSMPRPQPPSPPSREMPRSASMPPPPSRELPRSASMPPPPSRELPRPPVPAGHVSAHLTVLRPDDVTPRHAEPGTVVPPRASLAAPPAPRAAAAAPIVPASAPAPASAPTPSGMHSVPVSARRALVADDSLVARIFLARLLERRGYVVEAVGDGESMWEQLRRGPWSLVCADVTMPDSHGRAHLERLLDFRAACREPFALVTLTRDAAEEHEAALAGATLHLRKPFDPAALDRLLDR